VQQCRCHHQRQSRRRCALAAPDRLTPTRSATRPGARQRSRPDAEIDGAESSWHCLSASSHADNATRRSRKKKRGRDKYHSYQDEVCRWSREIDAPTAAAVAWRVIRARRARGCGAPAGRAGEHGGLPRGLLIARRPGPGQAAGGKDRTLGPVLFCLDRTPGTGGPDEASGSTFADRSQARCATVRRREFIAALGSAVAARAQQPDRIEGRPVWRHFSNALKN
jgi:hypothetical protein